MLFPGPTEGLTFPYAKFEGSKSPHIKRRLSNNFAGNPDRELLVVSDGPKCYGREFRNA